MRLCVSILITFFSSIASFHSISTNRKWLHNISTKSSLYAQKDSQGYLIKDRTWFDGLSTDAGASLTDPRAIPKEAADFANRINNGGKVESIDETLKLIDSLYDYFAVPFSNGDLLNEANKNTGNHHLAFVQKLSSLFVATPDLNYT